MESKPAVRLSPIQTIGFFNSLALGVVVPVLYYMIELPHAGWIAILFVIEITGRFAGRPICDLARRQIGFGRSLAIFQVLNAISYGLIALVGYLRPSQTVGFALIYLSRAIGSIAGASVVSVRPIAPERGSSAGVLSAQQGFGFGCVLTLLLGNHKPVADSILQTGGLLVPGVAAMGLSLFTAAAASQAVEDSPVETPVVQTSRGPSGVLALAVMLACESAFAMILCVLPLTTKEILAFTPATLALFLACLAFVSVSIARFILGRNFSRAFMLNLGIFLASVGLVGLSTALWVSWQYQYPHHVLMAYRTMFGAGLVTAAGHGMLRITLPDVRDKAMTLFPPKSRGLSIDGLTAGVAILSVLFVGRIWELHERAALAAGGAVLLAALPLAIVLTFLQRRETHSGGFDGIVAE